MTAPVKNPYDKDSNGPIMRRHSPDYHNLKFLFHEKMSGQKMVAVIDKLYEVSQDTKHKSWHKACELICNYVLGKPKETVEMTTHSSNMNLNLNALSGEELNLFKRLAIKAGYQQEQIEDQSEEERPMIDK